MIECTCRTTFIEPGEAGVSEVQVVDLQPHHTEELAFGIPVLRYVPPAYQPANFAYSPAGG
jgi:hypothetical protein